MPPQRGHNLVRVWSDTCPDVVKAHTKKGMEVSYVGEVQVIDSSDLSNVVATLRNNFLLGPAVYYVAQEFFCLPRGGC